MPAPSTHDLSSARRLQALRRTRLLDVPAQETFDRLARFAARVLEVPVSLLSLLDVDRQLFIGQHGLDDTSARRRGIPLVDSFCPHVVAGGRPFVVADARSDPRVSDYRSVETMSLVAYAGVPLLGPDGEVVGTMCAVSPRPRSWSADDLQLLSDLAADAEEHMRARWTSLERREQVLSMGHRLRNGFAALSLETENLAAHVTDPDQHELAVSLGGAVMSQASAIEDVLRQAEDLETGLLAPVQVEAVMDEVVRRFALRDGGGDRPVVSTPAPGVVLAPVEDLCHVLDGLVTALLTHGRGRVSLAARVQDDLVRFRVADEGDGLPPEVARAITARHDVTVGGDRRATVSLAERAVQALGGRLVLAVDGPSTVTLLLPNRSDGPVPEPRTDLWQSRSRHVEQP